MVRRIQKWLRSVLQRSTVEREMRDEMRYHIEQKVALLVERGMARAAAEREAQREFGNVGLHEEHARDARGTQLIDALRADIRFAFRYFRRKPLASVTIVLVLALGIGGHAFQLSLLLATTTRVPMGISRSIPLVRIRGMQRAKDAPKWWPRSLSYPELRELAGRRDMFTGVAASTMGVVAVSTQRGSDGSQTVVQFITDGYFATLGIQPTHGPGLRADDTSPTAIISYAMWEDVFNRGDVAGRELIVNGIAVRIAGVANEGFTGVFGEDRRGVIWMPVSSRAIVLAANGATALALTSVDSTLFDAVARLHPGVTPDQASAIAHIIDRQFTARMTPPTIANATMLYDADAVRMRGITSVDSDMWRINAIWGTITLLVLLIACTNVTGLAISGAVGRRQEIAIRISMGASRGRVLRQMLTESTILAMIGAALGLFTLWVIVKMVEQIEPGAAWVEPDLATVGLTMLVALGTGVLFGLTPALHATRQDVSSVLKGVEAGATRRSRAQSAFVIAQVTLTQPLLMFTASLLAMMLWKTPAVPPNDVPNHVLRLTSRWQTIPGSDEDRVGAVKRLEQRLAETPGVVGVMPEPAFMRSANMVVRTEDRGTGRLANAPLAFEMYRTRSGYFNFIDAPLVRGSDAHPPSDTTGTVVISSTLARELWGDADPIGRRFVQIRPIPGPGIRPELIVTGVYDARYIKSGDIAARVFRPGESWYNSALFVRTAPPASDMSAAVVHSAREVLPSTSFEPPLTMAQINYAAGADDRTLSASIAGVGALMLSLTALGLYGVVALAIAQRRREIGVRMALGAHPRQVVGLFTIEGLKLAVYGLALGLPIGGVGVAISINQITLSRDDNSSSMWLAILVIAALVVAVATIATLLPASRAARVDPVTALRAD